MYRWGGSDKTWHGKERDWGCSLATVLALWLLLGWSWWYVAVFGLSWAALSTYWKRSGDCKWYHWAMHGAGVGLACLPLYAIGVPLWRILFRAIFLAILMTVVSEASDDVWVEELSRGGLVVASLSLLV